MDGLDVEEFRRQNEFIGEDRAAKHCSCLDWKESSHFLPGAGSASMESASVSGST